MKRSIFLVAGMAITAMALAHGARAEQDRCAANPLQCLYQLTADRPEAPERQLAQGRPNRLVCCQLPNRVLRFQTWVQCRRLGGRVPPIRRCTWNARVCCLTSGRAPAVTSYRNCANRGGNARRADSSRCLGSHRVCCIIHGRGARTTSFGRCQALRGARRPASYCTQLVCCVRRGLGTRRRATREWCSRVRGLAVTLGNCPR